MLIERTAAHTHTIACHSTLWLLLFLNLPCVQSQAPLPREVVRGVRSRFWIDSSIRFALAKIMSSEIYCCVEMERTAAVEHSSNLICIEETVHSHVRIVPEYIGGLQSYTEKECRSICLQLANSIQILHNAGIAHRNLHLENVMIDSLVSYLDFCLHAQARYVERIPLTPSPSTLTVAKG